MKIVSVRERTVPLGSDKANAAISFASMTASAVVIEIETARGRFNGLGFSSYGRYGHGGLLNERFIPRLRDADPGDLSDYTTGEFSMAAFGQVLMKDEKGGGHGERSGAVGVLETAMWDAWAKSEDLPLWALFQREYGYLGGDDLSAGQCAIYASGGHYRSEGDDSKQLVAEATAALDAGYGWFKFKVGGASGEADAARINAVVEAIGDTRRIAVDANCAFEKDYAFPRLSALDGLGLRWIEEPVEPLNYHGLKSVTSKLGTAVATGENIFSAADTSNLLRYGGLRPGKDILQMDIALSYGIGEFMRMLGIAEDMGWTRRYFIPHAGHQVALHAAGGLGLGGHETASDSNHPFGGVSDDTRIENGIAILSDVPGAGIEQKPALYRLFNGLVDT